MNYIFPNNAIITNCRWTRCSSFGGVFEV